MLYVDWFYHHGNLIFAIYFVPLLFWDEKSRFISFLFLPFFSLFYFSFSSWFHTLLWRWCTCIRSV